MLEAAFWLSLLVGIYPYLAYPVLVQVLGGAFRKRVRMDVSHQPTITVVIAAYNEAAHIESTVRNKLGQAYPSHLVNVIVVSDESSDNTDDIVASIASEDDRVMLLRQDPRQGIWQSLARPERSLFFRMRIPCTRRTHCGISRQPSLTRRLATRPDT
jgi:cellulose synthase/poly-beta-1,6-N-acetylglucosamine synthase-like glycosyltransferase